jgi:hypothetical protein
MAFPIFPSRAILALAFLAGCGLREIPRGAPPATPSAPSSDSAAPPAPPLAPPDGPPRPDGGATTADAPPTVEEPPPSGPGVTIAGTFVPRASAIVVLHIGHSNMAGRATNPPELKPFFYDTDPRLWVYAKGGTFRPAREPSAPDNQDGQAAGPGMALLRSALAVAPAGGQVISIGHGHSGSFAGYCSSFRKGGLFYDIVMAPARELKGKVTFAGIFTMFGQSEHNATAAMQSRFSDCMAGIAQEMRADLGEPELPFVIGDYEMGISRPDIAPTSSFARAIIAQIQMIPGKVPRSVIIPTLGFPMQDDHHFNMAGHKMWAERGIQLLGERGWAPWAAQR